MGNKSVSRFIVFITISTFFVNWAIVDSESNNVIKHKILEAGCPFVGDHQLLQQNVCLFPNYASTELPNSPEGATNVSMYLLHAFVLEVDEMKKQLTVELLQYIEWNEPRIRANLSATSKQNKIKLQTKNLKRIWHPDLDIFTKDLKEWKSIYDPLLYQEVYFSKGFNDEFIKVTALKSWTATIFCKFDFSLFPFDTQNCAFLQFGSAEDLQIISSCRKIHASEKYKLVGFDVLLSPVGCFGNDIGIKGTTTKKQWMDIGFNITLKREVQPYLYQYYFPSIAIVAVSFISFIIPLSAIPGRIALVVTQFLTLTNIFIHQMVST
jgi:hypothetical protein